MSRLRQVWWGALVGVVLVLVVGCTAGGLDGGTEATATLETIPGEDTFDSETAPTRSGSDCPMLDDVLLQLVEATDGLALAEELGLPVRDERVQVLIVLQGESTAFLDDYAAEVGTQVGNEVQAYVPIAQLCALSNDEGVLAVRVVSQPVP